MTPRVFAVSGYSDSGKTTVVRGLVRELTDRGYTVATIKSTNQDVPPPDGTDTWHHWEAGAIQTTLLGPSTTTIRYRRRWNVREILKACDTDFVIIEGMKHESFPRVWCTRLADPTEEMSDITHVLAIVVSEKSAESVGASRLPRIHRDDIKKIADLVEQHAASLSAHS
ncbi:MAG: molybdopterin-guanine dinucleotide biosynthesis protein B [Candidatus Thorarchaeota archaeon]